MELSIVENRDKISLCVIEHDLPALIKVRDGLEKDRKVMDKWFDKYIDMMDKKMKPETPNTPEWKLYNRKFEQYTDLVTLIKTADSYVRKLQAV